MKKLEDLIRNKTINEQGLVLTYWKQPELFDQYYLEPTTIINKEARALFILGRELYFQNYDLDNTASIVEFIELYPEHKENCSFDNEKTAFYYLEDVRRQKKAMSLQDFEARFNEQKLLAFKIEMLKFLGNKEPDFLNKTVLAEAIDSVTVEFDNIIAPTLNQYVKHGNAGTVKNIEERYADDIITYDFDNVASKLSTALNGFPFNCISSIAGLSGVGKSQFTMYFAVYSQIEQGHKVLLLTNELTIEDYQDMLTCIICKEKFNYTFNRSWFRDYKKMRQFIKENTIEYQMVIKAKTYIEEHYTKNNLLKIIELSNSSMNEVARYIRIYSKQGYQLVIYDTAKPDDSTNQAWAQITEMMKKLEAYTKLYNVHLFLPWQIANQYADVKRLTRQHLSESKDLVKLLTNLITIRLVYEDEYIDDVSGNKILKNFYTISYNPIKTENPIVLNKAKKYLLVYFDKLRFSSKGGSTLLFEFDTSTCTFKELYYVMQKH